MGAFNSAQSSEKIINDLKMKFPGLAFEWKTVEVYAPYHCPRCCYIWDTKARFVDHKDMCLIEPEALKEYAEWKKIDRFINTSTLAVEYDRQLIPIGRCDAVRQSGHRKGQFCLNVIKGTDGKCYIHTKSK